MRSRLRCVKNCAAPAAPGHVPAITGAPHRANRPTVLAVVVAVRATRRRHHHPPAPGSREVAHKVVGEVVATRIGHHDGLPKTSDIAAGRANRHARTPQPGLSVSRAILLEFLAATMTGTRVAERRAAWRSPRQASKAADGGRSSSTRVARPQPRGRDQRLRQVRRRQTGHCAVSVRRVRAGQQGRPSPIAPSYRCLGGGCRLALPLSLSWMWGSGGWER
jgi:hypothetical protein